MGGFVESGITKTDDWPGDDGERDVQGFGWVAARRIKLSIIKPLIDRALTFGSGITVMGHGARGPRGLTITEDAPGNNRTISVTRFFRLKGVRMPS